MRASAQGPAWALARVVLILAVLAAGGAVSLWLLGEGGVLAVGGAIVAVVLVWEFGWDRRRRKRARAELARPQGAPGTQALRSEAGTPHWTDRLPRPLRSVAQTGPLAVMAVAALGLAFVVVGLVGSTAGDGPDVRVRLEEGAQAEIEPPFGEHSRIRVTILRIVDGGEVGAEFPQPPRGAKFWAVDVSIENVGTLNVRAPGWGLQDSAGLFHYRTLEASIGNDLPLGPWLRPGETIAGWLVFKLAEKANVVWLRVAPFDPFDYPPNYLYFDAE